MSDLNNQGLRDVQLKGFLKLIYFILGADIVLLGWTVVNTDWIPLHSNLMYLALLFWGLILLSIVSGIIWQIFVGEFFRINELTLFYEKLGNVEMKKKAKKRMGELERTIRVSGMGAIIFLVLALVLFISIGFFVSRETPEKCVQTAYLEWREDNLEVLTNSSDIGGVVLPELYRNNSQKVTGRVKTIAKRQLGGNLKNQAIGMSARIILDQCGVDY